MYTTTPRSVKSRLPSHLLLPLLLSFQSSPRLPKLLSPSLRVQKDLAKLVIKIKALMGPKKKLRARGPSPSQRPEMLPRSRKLQLRQRKQRPRLKKLILRPRMLLSPSQAKKKTLLLQRPRLSTYDFLVVSFVFCFCFFFVFLFFFCFFFCFFFL